MTVKELTDYQNSSGNICLMRQGLFFRAYNQGAVLLNELFGYMIKQGDNLQCGRIYYVGFPASAANKVVDGIVAGRDGCSIVRQEDNYIEFAGIGVDYNPDKAEESAVKFTKASSPERRRKSGNAKRSSRIETMILDFDISRSTPLDALHLIAHLQQTIIDR